MLLSVGLNYLNDYHRHRKMKLRFYNQAYLVSIFLPLKEGRLKRQHTKNILATLTKSMCTRPACKVQLRQLGRNALLHSL
jgi:hypothetical protein